MGVWERNLVSFSPREKVPEGRMRVREECDGSCCVERSRPFTREYAQGREPSPQPSHPQGDSLWSPEGEGANENAARRAAFILNFIEAEITSPDRRSSVRRR